MWITIIWPLIIFFNDIRKGIEMPDIMQIFLCLFLISALISTLTNLSSIQDYQYLTISDSFLSLWQVMILTCILFPWAKKEKTQPFFIRVCFITWLYIFLLAMGSLFLYLCFRMNIILPGGLGSAEQIFTYGHLGEKSRFCGLFGYSADGGILCTLCVLIGIYLTEQKKLPIVMTVAVSCLLILTIYLLDVRTSMLAIALIVLIIVYHYLSKKISPLKALLILMAIIILTAGVIVVIKTDTITHYVSQMRENPEDTMRFLTTGRSTHWTNAISGFLKKPIFGWGWNNSIYITYFDSHNLFFNLLLWTGAIGTGLFIGFIISFLVTIIRNWKTIQKNRISSLLLLVVVIFASSMLDRAVIGTSNTAVDSSFFWLSAGLLAYCTVNNSENENDCSVK